ncbi:MAG TPA: twin-arginine translocase subunit TatC [Bryobacteraceae bacterium]|nr:twin-arginine translocase subunit TatC [Bryobacteraceae bacterium]
MEDDKQGVPPPEGEGSPEAGQTASNAEVISAPPVEVVTDTSLIRRPPPPPPPPAPALSPEDEEEEGMLRMSFMEHLEELRNRILKALYGLGIAFVFALVFAGKLWDIISDPAVEALKHLHVEPPQLAQLTPMEAFSVIWVKLPLLCSVFIASPWIVYQVWAFISPGLYRKEKRLALPFVLTTAGLFIGGGCFAYFLAFRYGLEFLLGIGMMNNVRPVVSITEYFDLFVNVTLGVGLVFEMPVLIFLLTLLHILSPRFLLRHSRYAILIIVIIAAIITPTPDVFNLMLFAVPMCLLYFVGVFAGLGLVMRREGRTLPWKKVLPIVVSIVLVVGAIAGIMIHFHLRLSPKWPYLIH